MKTTIAPLLLFTLLAPLNAEEDKMKFDKLLDYTNVTVTKIEPDGIRIIHESGAAKIAYERTERKFRFNSSRLPKPTRSNRS